MAEPKVGLLVTNLFLRVPVDAAVRDAGAVPVALEGPGDERARSCTAVVADLDVLGDDPAAAVKTLAAAGAQVLAFGPHVDAARLAAVRSAGAVVLPRGAFLARLPELLRVALARPSRSR